MKKYLLRLIAWLLLATAPAWAATPVLDGNSLWVTHSSNAALVLTLTTSNANDIVVVAVTLNGGTVTSISDVAGLTWALRKTTSGLGASNPIEEWYAKSTGALTGDVITVNVSASTTFVGGVAFGVSGATFASPLDPYTSALPFGIGGSAQTFSTYNANTMVIGLYRFQSTSTPTAGAGWTGIGTNTSTFELAEYQTFTAAQTSTSAAIGTGAGNANGGIVDAFTSDAPNTIFSSKTNAYDILTAGTDNAISASKTNAYDILQAGTANAISVSKMNTYMILQTARSSAGFFHVFP